MSINLSWTCLVQQRLKINRYIYVFSLFNDVILIRNNNRLLVTATTFTKSVGWSAATGGQSIREHVRDTATNRTDRAIYHSKQHVDDQRYWWAQYLNFGIIVSIIAACFCHRAWLWYVLFWFLFSSIFHPFFFLLGFAPAAPPANNNFVTDNSFSSVFGNQDQQSSKCLLHIVVDIIHERIYTRLRFCAPLFSFSVICTFLLFFLS